MGGQWGSGYTEWGGVPSNIQHTNTETCHKLWEAEK